MYAYVLLLLYTILMLRITLIDTIFVRAPTLMTNIRTYGKKQLSLEQSIFLSLFFWSWHSFSVSIEVPSPPKVARHDYTNRGRKMRPKIKLGVISLIERESYHRFPLWFFFLFALPFPLIFTRVTMLVHVFPLSKSGTLTTQHSTVLPLTS